MKKNERLDSSYFSGKVSRSDILSAIDNLNQYLHGTVTDEGLKETLENLSTKLGTTPKDINFGL